MRKIGFVVVVMFMAMLAVSVPAEAKKTYYDKDYSYQVKDREAIVTGCYKYPQEGKLIIPSSLGGFPVTGIASRTFAEDKWSAVYIPDTVEQIDGYAFIGCKMVSVRLPKNLKKIEMSTFESCRKLTSITFNKKLTSIGDLAFADCTSLKKVTLPSSLEEIDDEAFAYCYKLATVKLNKKLRKIGECAFRKCYKLKKITLPSHLNVVGERAFLSCKDLSAVYFKNAGTKLKRGVFRRCTSLKKLDLPKKLRSIPEETFVGCSALREVALPKTISIIRKRAFADCTSLKKIVMNKKAYAIGDRAFEGSGLRKIKMNRQMQFIGNGAFRDTDIRSITLGSRVTYIGNRIFSDCKKLQRVYIPASVKGINPGAFNNCTSLRAINVASGNANYCSEAGVLYNASKTKLIQYPLHKTNSSFRTPGSLQRIRSRAFSGNLYLKNVTTSADSIGSRAFYEMKNLRSVTLLSGVRRIGESAFDNDFRLNKITVPDSVTHIGPRAFAFSNVRTLHIPSALTSFDKSAVYDCTKLAYFTGGGGRYRVKEGVLYNGNMTKLIKYPARKAGSTFTAPNSVRSVSAWAFEYCANLTKLYFGKNLDNLGYRAIYKAKKLRSLVLDTKKLGYCTLSVNSCHKLAVIVAPNNSLMRELADEANVTLITL